MKRTGWLFLCLVLFVLPALGACKESTGATTSFTTPTAISTTTTSPTTASVWGSTYPLEVSLSSGTVFVEPFRMDLHSHFYVEGSGWIYADGVGAFGFDVLDYSPLFPTLPLAGDLSVRVGEMTLWSDPFLYDSEGHEIGARTLESLSALDPGDYILRILVDRTGRSSLQGEESFTYYFFAWITVPANAE